MLLMTLVVMTKGRAQELVYRVAVETCFVFLVVCALAKRVMVLKGSANKLLAKNVLLANSQLVE